MNDNTAFPKPTHLKSIISNLKSNKALPFREVLSSETIGEYLKGFEYRDRVFSPDITTWTFLSQVLDDDQSLQAAVSRVVAFYITEGWEVPSSNTSAYSQARMRLSEELLINLTKKSAEQLEASAPSAWFWRNKSVKMVDGSTVSMPDTLENQTAYPQMHQQRKGVGFPIARIVAVLSYSTGAILDLAIGPYSGKGTGEHALLRQIMSVFKSGDVALDDAYYASFFLIAMLKQLGIEAVFPVHGARGVDFRRGKRLGKYDHLVDWKKPKKPVWMEQAVYDLFPHTLQIRETSIQSCRAGFKTKMRRIVTTFLNSKKVTNQNLSMLYDYRWNVELDLKSIKETMHMGILRGKTPSMVRKEIWAHLLAYNLIRKIMAQAGFIYNIHPRQLSFKLALQVIKSFRQAGIFHEDLGAYLELLRSIVHKRVGNRPGRQEPRRVKRRPKPFQRLQKPRFFYYGKAA